MAKPWEGPLDLQISRPALRPYGLMAESSDGLVGGIEGANGEGSQRFGPNTAEVEAFIQAAAHLTPQQWRRVLAARRLVASVTKESPGQAAESVESIQAAIRTGQGRQAEPMAQAGEALFEGLQKRSDEEVVSAWQAVSALVSRHHLSALKFAAHYAPFATLIPVSVTDAVDPATKRFLAAIKRLSADQCEILSRPWRLEHNASRALLQAVARGRHLNVEEAVALAALKAIPAQLAGDAGWAAVRTAVHGGRVLSRLAELASDEVTILWAPLQLAIPLESVVRAAGHQGERKHARAVVPKAMPSVKPPRVAAATGPKTSGPYGPNSIEVT